MTLEEKLADFLIRQGNRKLSDEMTHTRSSGQIDPRLEYQMLERPDPTKEEPGLGSPMLDPTTDFFGTGFGKTLAKVVGETVTAVNAAKGATLFGVTAFHGSPHKFDQFRLDKIGTGEGAQAYGHGLYFAENPGVAREYQDRLTGLGRSDAHGEALHWLSKSGKDPVEAEKLYRSVIAKNKDTVDPGVIRAINSPDGYLYKVDIHDESVNKMLDWDKPLSQQPESVRKALEPLMKKYMTPGTFEDMSTKSMRGESVHNFLKKYYGGDEAIASKLKEAGIPGIKYLDQGSRNSGQPYWNVIDKTTGKTVQAVLDKPTNLPSKYKVEGPINPTRNFVVFDENLPKILERK